MKIEAEIWLPTILYNCPPLQCLLFGSILALHTLFQTVKLFHSKTMKLYAQSSLDCKKKIYAAYPFESALTLYLAMASVTKTLRCS